MNAATPQQLARIAEWDIQDRLKSRSARLEYFMHELKYLARTSGRLSAKEAQDLVCCLSECIGDDLREAKASLLELSCDLDGIVFYGAASND